MVDHPLRLVAVVPLRSQLNRSAHNVKGLFDCYLLVYLGYPAIGILILNMYLEVYRLTLVFIQILVLSHELEIVSSGSKGNLRQAIVFSIHSARLIRAITARIFLPCFRLRPSYYEFQPIVPCELNTVSITDH